MSRSGTPTIEFNTWVETCRLHKVLDEKSLKIFKQHNLLIKDLKLFGKGQELKDLFYEYCQIQLNLNLKCTDEK